MKPIIIGAGICGLTTALALQKVGISCQIFERTSVLQPVGAGIWMAPNAMKVFDWLGIGDAVRAAGMPLEKVELANQQLIPFKKTKSSYVRDSEGNSIISIHRAKLQEILLSQLNPGSLHLGKTFEKSEEKDGKLKVSFLDGTEAEGSILLAADGLHSAVRQQLFPESSLHYSGQSCWRGVSDIILDDKYKAACIEAWGPGIRFGFSVIAAGKVYWFAVIKAPQGQKDQQDIKSKISTVYQDFAQPVRDIISNTPENGIIRTDLSDLNRLPTWHKGLICLIGDAGHATTPNMGQGGAQGVEDAYYISQLLAKNSDPKQAFQQFESIRREKVDYIVKNSRLFGKMAHSFWGQLLTKTVIKLSSEKMLAKQMEKVYELKEIKY